MSQKTPQTSSVLAKNANKNLSEKTVIFFDWDDTLQASSVLCTNGINLQTVRMPREIEIMFAPLQDQVIKLLNIATDFTAYVFVVTNAEQGWVELSCQKFMPKVAKRIERIQIISARTTYQDFYPDQPNIWKRTAFTDRINSIFGINSQSSLQNNSSIDPTMTPLVGPPDINVISFGDSECERTALLSLGKLCHPSAKIKSIKFVERPSVEQLKRQLQMVETNFSFIMKHEGNLDLMLQISCVNNNVSQPPPPPPAPSTDNAGINEINHGFNDPNSPNYVGNSSVGGEDDDEGGGGGNNSTDNTTAAVTNALASSSISPPSSSSSSTSSSPPSSSSSSSARTSVGGGGRSGGVNVTQGGKVNSPLKKTGGK